MCGRIYQYLLLLNIVVCLRNLLATDLTTFIFLSSAAARATSTPTPIRVTRYYVQRAPHNSSSTHSCHMCKRATYANMDKPESKGEEVQVYYSPLGALKLVANPDGICVVKWLSESMNVEEEVVVAEKAL